MSNSLARGEKDEKCTRLVELWGEGDVDKL